MFIIKGESLGSSLISPKKIKTGVITSQPLRSHELNFVYTKTKTLPECPLKRLLVVFTLAPIWTNILLAILRHK